jgi:formate dehydrogenase iron-sulfur subunit
LRSGGSLTLIDISKCIGCKACQAACYEWNDLRDEIGINIGSYQNPHDLTENTWTLMRFSEVEPEDGKLEWLIRKDGCMHCADPGCLKACPAPGAIVQYANGIVDFISENCIGCGYCVNGCPFNIPRISQKDQKAYKCTLCSDRVSVGLEPACAKACPTQAISFGTKADMIELAQTRVTDLNERSYEKPGFMTHPVSAAPMSCRPAGSLLRPTKGSEDQRAGRDLEGCGQTDRLIGLGLTALFGFFHYVTAGPNEVDEADEEEAKKTIGEPDQKKTADDRAQIRHRRPFHACCASQSLA